MQAHKIMNFPFISDGHIRVFAVGHDPEGPRKRLPNIWRLDLAGIRRVGTETFWSCDIGFRTYRDCCLIEARKANWHDRQGISGWILFRGKQESNPLRQMV
jgi:hypothetical protein